MGGLGRALLVSAGLALALLPGCSHGPKSGPGTWVVVQRGDNLWSLADRHHSTVAAIEHANDDVDAHSLVIGRKLWIPRVVVHPKPDLRHTARRPVDGECGVLARQEALAFEWPVLGEVTSDFGVPRGSHLHDGIDLATEKGTPIHAAESGRVIYSGDELGDYGRVVILKHEGRWATIYAHNSKNLVKEGQEVSRGDVIAKVGDTGNATAPHLHFEVRRSNEPEDPRSCLP